MQLIKPILRMLCLVRESCITISFPSLQILNAQRRTKENPPSIFCVKHTNPSFFLANPASALCPPFSLALKLTLLRSAK
jgi:hypothetical protein